MSHANMPGIEVDLKDGGLVLPPPQLEGDTVLILGTADDGPVGRPVQVLRLSDAFDIFGDYNKGTLLKAADQAFTAGAKSVRLMRVGKTALAKATLDYEINLISITPGADSGESLVLTAKNPGTKYNNVIVTVDGNIPNTLSIQGADGETATFNIDLRDQEIDIRGLVALINADPVANKWVVASFNTIAEVGFAYGNGTKTTFVMTDALESASGNKKGVKGTEVVELKAVKEIRQISQLLPLGVSGSTPLRFKPDVTKPIVFTTATVPAVEVPLERVTSLTDLVPGKFYIYPDSNVIRFGEILTENLNMTFMYQDEYIIGAEAVLVNEANGSVQFPFADRVPAASPLKEAKSVVIADPSAATVLSSMGNVIVNDPINYPITLDGISVDPNSGIFEPVTAEGKLVLKLTEIANGDHLLSYYYDASGTATPQSDTITETGALSYATPEKQVVMASILVDGVDVASYPPGLATADAEGRVTFDLTLLFNGTHTITYDVALPNLTFEFERLPKLPSVPTGTVGNKHIVRLSGGTDGIFMRSSDKYLDLAAHYLMLENAAGIDHIVISHAFQDEEVFVQAGNGMLEEKNFTQQLAQFCHIVSTHDRFCFGYMNTTPIEDVDLMTVAQYVNSRVENAKHKVGYLDEQERVPSRRADIGRYVSVPCVDIIFASSLDGRLYVSGGAAAYAGLVAILPVGVSPTNRVIPGAVAPRFEMNVPQMSRLIDSRYIVFKFNSRRETVCADAMTAAVKGDYTRLSTARAVRAAVESVRVSAEPFIGRNAGDLPTRNAMDAKIKGDLDRLRDNEKAFKAYSWKLFSTAAEDLLGEATGELVIVPNHELRKLKVPVSLRPQL